MSDILDDINRYWSVNDVRLFENTQRKLVFHKLNQYLESLSIKERIVWSLKYLPKQIVLSSSFGIQSVVSLHLLTRYYSNIPIVLIDTGYLFPETYYFIDRLTEKMHLNLHVFRSQYSAAWQESRYGKLWEQGLEGIKKYNLINKIEPMRHALKTLKVGTWLAGLRRKQTDSRRNLSIISVQDNVFKFLPIVDWDNYKINQYIKRHSLESHPLKNRGYISVGDVHTTSALQLGMQEKETRFFGLQRECGLHSCDDS